MKESCCPAKLESSKSSAVAELLTEINIGSLEDFKIDKAPGESFKLFKSILKWS